MKKQFTLPRRALDFLSQDINEEMTHTCKERNGGEKEREEGEKKKSGVRDVGFRGDEGR